MTEEFMKALYHELSDAAIAVIKKHGEEVENSSSSQLASCLVNTAIDAVLRVTKVSPYQAAYLVCETAMFIKEKTKKEA